MDLIQVLKMNPTCLHGLEIDQELDLKLNPTILHGPWTSIKIEPKKIS